MQLHRNKERGSVFISVLLMFLPMCALVGLVTDVGWWYFTAQSAHAAAEAAALAAVRSAMDDVNGGGSYTCGSNGLACQAATNCPITIPNPTTNNLQYGCAYAISNGFTEGGLGGRQTVTIEANVPPNYPAVSGVTALDYWVTVRISQQNPLTFLAVLGGNTTNVGVSATAAVVNTVPGFCVTALDPSASPGVKAMGHTNVTLQNCGMRVDSNATSALNVGGSACVTAGFIQVVGGASVTGCTTPSPTVNVSAFSDPLGALAAPTVPSGTCSSANNPTPTMVNGVLTYQPGNYCGGLDITTQAAFSSGVYNLLGGGLTCNGNCTLSGSGVTFYNTCNPSPCNGGSSNFGIIQLNGNSTLNLSAPTTGPFQGILFFEDRTVAAGFTDKINGNANYTLDGTLYFPKSTLYFSGDSSGSTGTTVIPTVVVADQIVFDGNSGYLQVGNGTSEVPSQPTAALIQ